MKYRIKRDELRRLRIEKFLSQEELALRSGLKPWTIYRLERQGDLGVQAGTVRKLAETLGVEPEDLATIEEEVVA